MTELFLRLLNISITAGWIVLALLLLRLLLRKAPKWINCLLWAIVALRLLIPFFPESRFSLIPSAEVFPREIAAQSPALQSGIPAGGTVEPLMTGQLAQQGAWEKALPVLSAVWLAGMAVMLLYSQVSYWRLRHKVQASILRGKNVYACDQVDSPFILGFFQPRIYIPSGMEETQLQYVLAHENAHIKRRDHWWKPVGFVLLSVYWFHPLLWLAYILLCRDIERACDEKAIAGMDNIGKKRYSEALIACSIYRRMIMACPVAFGEVAVKDRIKGVLSYKKPAFWIVVVSVVACGVTAVCFLTDPKTCKHEYSGQITVQSTCAQAGTELFTCTKCEDSYTVSVPLVAHSYDEGTVTQTPDCIHTGTKERTCTDCGAKTTETMGMTAHTAGQITVLKDPNCTETGRMSTTCTVCSAAFEEDLPLDSQVHDMKETVIRAATCTAAGEGVRTCTRCDHSESCTYSQHSHNFVDYGLLLKTCYAHKRQQICTHCNLVQIVELDDYGHNFVNGRCTSCRMKKSSTTGSSFTTSTTTNPLPGPIVWDIDAYMNQQRANAKNPQ